MSVWHREGLQVAPCTDRLAKTQWAFLSEMVFSALHRFPRVGVKPETRRTPDRRRHCLPSTGLLSLPRPSRKLLKLCSLRSTSRQGPSFTRLAPHTFVCSASSWGGSEGGSFSCRRWRLTRRSVRMLRPLRPGLQVSACCWRVAVWFHHSYMLLVSCFPLAFCKFTLFRFHFQRVAQLDFALCETPHKTLRVTPFFFFLLTLH